jgi:hypothetical protein
MDLSGRGSTALVELFDIEKEFHKNEMVSVSKSHEYKLTAFKNISKTRMIDNVEREFEDELIYDYLLAELNKQHQSLNLTSTS